MVIFALEDELEEETQELTGFFYVGIQEDVEADVVVVTKGLYKGMINNRYIMIWLYEAESRIVPLNYYL